MEAVTNDPHTMQVWRLGNIASDVNSLVLHFFWAHRYAIIGGGGLTLFYYSILYDGYLINFYLFTFDAFFKFYLFISIDDKMV